MVIRKKKRGRKPKYVVYGGKVIEGLSYNPANLTYYYLDRQTGKKTWATRDIGKANRQFLLHKEQTAPEPTMPIASNKAETIPTQLLQGLIFGKNKEGRHTVSYQPIIEEEKYTIPESFIIEEFKKLLAEDPVRLAKLAGIEELAYLHRVQIKKRITLTEILNLYMNRTLKPISPQNKKETRIFWTEFAKLVDVENIDELTLVLMNKYQNEVHKVAKSKTYRPHWLSKDSRKSLKGKTASSTWINHRLHKVKTILNNSLSFIEDSTDITRVISYTNHFHLAEANKPNPTPITREDFWKLYKTADTKWKAILTLSVNAGLYLKDVEDIAKDEINFKKSELRMKRRKTGITRIAVLHPLTIKALNNYLAKENADTDYLFVNTKGNKLDAHNTRNMFSKLRKKAGVSDKVKFADLRDGTATTAAEATNVNSNEIKYILGHSNGITDFYADRRSAQKLVGNVCKAISDYYFD